MIKEEYKYILKEIKKIDEQGLSESSIDDLSDLLMTLDKLSTEISAYKTIISNELLNREFTEKINLEKQMKIYLGNKNSVTEYNTQKIFSSIKDDDKLLKDFIKAISIVKAKVSDKLKPIVEKYSKVIPGETNCVIKVSKLSKKELLEMTKE